MSSQRYERVHANDDDDDATSPVDTSRSAVPHSPPPSFRSRASSPTSRHHGQHQHLLAEHDDPLASDADRTLADTFDSPSDDDDDDGDGDHRHHGDDRQRLMRADGSADALQPQQQQAAPPRDALQRRVTEFPTFAAQQPGTRVVGGGSMANDGVFANLSAKPTRGDTDHVEEKPPTYEQAAADATPPYWETTIHLPGLSSPDEVFVDGLPVGSVFSFIWNAMISMSFQVIGFLLTYLLHTTHAAKNGSRAGLGITLVQFGFNMKGSGNPFGGGSGGGSGGGGGEAGAPSQGAPPDPNSHDFDPDTMGNTGGSDGGILDVGSLTRWDWLAYILMIVGWFILIRSVSDFLRARRHEQLVLQSPDRGLGVPVVAEGERPETSV